jgi:hypothetical protein
MPSTARNNLEVPPFPPTAILPDTKDEHNATESIEDSENTYPDGGLRAWLVVLGSFCGMYATPSPSHPSLLKS